MPLKIIIFYQVKKLIMFKGDNQWPKERGVEVQIDNKSEIMAGLLGYWIS